MKQLICERIDRSGDSKWLQAWEYVAAHSIPKIDGRGFALEADIEVQKLDSSEVVMKLQKELLEHGLISPDAAIDDISAIIGEWDGEFRAILPFRDNDEVRVFRFSVQEAK